MVRRILSVIIGYAIFVITSLALFRLSGQKPHAVATASFMILTALYGAFFSFIAGIVTQLIARTKELKQNFILAVVISGFATFSLFKSGGAHWTQLLAIFLFGPVSVLGGIFYRNRCMKR
jgi:hypothetical protein